MPSEKRESRLYYHRLPEFWRKENKLDFLSDNSLGSVDWQRLVPNRKHTWRRTDTEDEFDSFLAIGSKEAKRAKTGNVQTVFKLYSNGILSGRDAYVYGFSGKALWARVAKLAGDYNLKVAEYMQHSVKPNVDDFVDYNKLKWSRNLKRELIREKIVRLSSRNLRESFYRPFTKKWHYFDSILIDELSQQIRIFPTEPSEAENRVICLTDKGSEKPFMTLISDSVPDLHLVGPGASAQCFPFYTYDEDGSNRRENITDYALDQFRSHYNDPAISKWDIFYYVYGILHHPGYRERYALDLKRNLPRIPFAPVFSTPSPGPFPEASGKGSSLGAKLGQVQVFDHPPIAMGGTEGVDSARVGGFWHFSQAGQQLADLHLNYESVDRYGLDWQVERKPPSYRVEKMLPKGKVDSSEGSYKVYETLKYNDTLTLHGIPERAFAYRLGNRSALDWIVDQYRVKTDRRSGISHDPNGYSDDPQYILKLIERVITVIVEGLAQLPFRPESADD